MTVLQILFGLLFIDFNIVDFHNGWYLMMLVGSQSTVSQSVITEFNDKIIKFKRKNKDDGK